MKRGRKEFTNRDLVRLKRVEFLVNEAELKTLKDLSIKKNKSIGSVIRETLKLS